MNEDVKNASLPKGSALFLRLLWLLSHQNTKPLLEGDTLRRKFVVG